MNFDSLIERTVSSLVEARKDHAVELNKFIAGTGIDPALGAFLKSVARTADEFVQHNAPGVSQSFFSYAPKSRMDNDTATMTFDWEGNFGFNFNPDLTWAADSKDPAVLIRARVDARKSVAFVNALKAALHNPTHPDVKSVDVGAGWDDGLGLSVSFTHDIFPEAWEEGSAGYKD